jgi:hypothetical protein
MQIESSRDEGHRSPQMYHQIAMMITRFPGKAEFFYEESDKHVHGLFDGKSDGFSYFSHFFPFLTMLRDPYIPKALFELFISALNGFLTGTLPWSSLHRNTCGSNSCKAIVVDCVSLTPVSI